MTCIVGHPEQPCAALQTLQANSCRLHDSLRITNDAYTAVLRQPSAVSAVQRAELCTKVKCGPQFCKQDKQMFLCCFAVGRKCPIPDAKLPRFLPFVALSNFNVRSPPG